MFTWCCGRTYSWVMRCLGYWHIQNWMWHLGMLEVMLEQVSMFLWDTQTPKDLLGLIQLFITMLCSLTKTSIKSFGTTAVCHSNWWPAVLLSVDFHCLIVFSWVLKFNYQIATSHFNFGLNLSFLTLVHPCIPFLEAYKDQWSSLDWTLLRLTPSICRWKNKCPPHGIFKASKRSANLWLWAAAT